MNYRSSSFTGRAHRDLRSAFGPYTSTEFYDQDATDYGALWWIVMLLVCSVAIGVIFY